MCKIYFFMCSILCLFGCDRAADVSVSSEATRLSVLSSESIWFACDLSNFGFSRLSEPASRATETNFEAMDEIGVFVYAGYLGSGPYHSSNMRYYTVDGTPDGTTSPQWTTTEPLGGALAYGTTYYATAYYPYQAGLSNATQVSYALATNQTATQALERSDFMWATPVTVTTATATPTAKFSFAHLMCKLVLSLDVPTLIDGSVASKINSIKIKNLKTKCTINLGTGALSDVSIVADITPRLVSGDWSAGATSKWEAIVLPQTVASGVSIVEAKIQTAAGEKTVAYTLPAGGVTLGSGQKITYLLTNSVDVSFTTELMNSYSYTATTNQPLNIKVAKGVAWTLSSSAPVWLTVSKTTGGSYGTSISGTGTGAEETILVAWTDNTGTGSAVREATLTLTGKGSAQYKVVQPNYIAPNVTTVFPSTITMAAATYRLPAITVGNGNWYIKSDKHGSNVRFSRFNKAYTALTAGDTVAVFAPSYTGTKVGALLSGDYQNCGGQLWIVVKPGSKPTFTMNCGGKSVTVNASAI